MTNRLLDAEIAVRDHGWRWINATQTHRMLLPADDDPRFFWTAKFDENGIPHYLPYYSKGETE